jgi:hypothetical protein
MENNLLNYFYSNYNTNYDENVILNNGIIQTKYTLKEDLTNLPKIIFLDEASKYDYIQTKLLTEAAQHYGIIILAAGDID